jgi:integrase
LKAVIADLFDTPMREDARRALEQAFEAWIAERSESTSTARSQRALRPASVEVYRDMWGTFTAWCLDRRLALASIGAADLAAFLDALGGSREATPRYLKRMLLLIGRVDRHQASRESRSPNAAIRSVGRLPRFRFAGTPDEDLPNFITGREARRLVEYVTRRGSTDADGGSPRWQDVRDRTAVAIQLGSGITPGEARMLTLDQIVRRGGRGGDEPWALSLPASGNFLARQTPLASWAGRQLAHWLDVRAAQRIPGDAVFPSTRSGKPWSKSSSIRAFQQVLEAADIDPRGGSFKLRHTFALRQLTRYPEDQVAIWLGVQDPAMMARYRRTLFQPVDVV